MAELNYAFIKGIDVVNIAVFDDPSDELLAHFKEEFELDNIILAVNNAGIGGTYEDGKFWTKKPYPSWVKGTDEWEPPIPMPIDDNAYTWNEETTSWDILTIPE